MVVLLAGIAAGALLRDPLFHALHGRDRSDSAAPAGARKQLWTCGMHPQVIRDEPGLCPICHMELTPLELDDDSASAGGATTAGERKVKYWWDPMIGAASISDEPGTSAMGMALVPVYEDEVRTSAAAVTIDPVVVQNMGVRLAKAQVAPVSRTMRMVGYLEEAQPLAHDVNLRVSGWIEKLHAATVGVHLERGDALFDLYSPEVQVAVEELISARKATVRGAAADALARRTASTIHDAARRKLELWGLGSAQVDRLATLDKAPKTVTFASPITGHVTEKDVVEGSAVSAGDRAMRIVDHSTLWLDAQVYAQDQSFMELGRKVTAVIEGLPGRAFEAEIIFIHPHVDPTTRTATVRIAVANADMVLRPGMYATVEMHARLADAALVVPREAVIDTGVRQVAFVATGEGRFEPREVSMGVSGSDGMVQIVEGIAPGEQVVTSGQFLLDAESRMREAIQKYLSERLAVAPGAAAPETRAGGREADAVDAAETHASGHGASRDGTTPEAAAPSCGDADAVFAPYLAMAEAFGADTPPAAPLATEGLVTSARKLLDESGGQATPRAAMLVAAASALRGKPVEEQRAMFATVSEAMLALAETCPPSRAVAETLFVMTCPMASARWLQTTKDIANPYYATEMKACGEVQRTIATRAND